MEFIGDLAYAVGPEILILYERTDMYVHTLLQFFKERDLVVFPEKSTVTLFTPYTGKPSLS